MEYSLAKAVHIIGAILLLGNIVVTAWWKAMANRTGDPVVIAFGQRQVTLTDFIFTLPGAVLIVAAGDYIGYALLSDSWQIRWLTWGRILFILSGVIWLTVLVPIQTKQARMAREFARTGTIPAAYWRLNACWYGFGLLAVLLPFGNIYWMVFKPA